MSPLPEQKHSDDELNELRMRNAFATRPPVQEIKSQALHLIPLTALYLLCLASAALAIGAMYEPGIICAGIAILASLFVYWRKPRSRHHASLIVIISLLVLVFGTVYYLEQLEASNYDPQGPIGY